MKIMAIALVAIIAIFDAAYAKAENTNSFVRKDSVSVEIFFHVVKTDIDLGYKDNRARLEKFVEDIQKANRDKTHKIECIRISGYASPEGEYKQNQQLAYKRAANTAEYLRVNAGIPDSLISIQHTDINWQGLARAVRESSMPNKAKVLDIICNEPEFTYGSNGKGLIRSRKQLLMSLEGGRTWTWMLNNLYPQLRSSASVVCYIETVGQEDIDSEKSSYVLSTDTVAVIEEEVLEEPCDTVAVVPEYEEELTRYPIVALRTNMLLPLLNFGAELPIGNRWSIGADYYYPWSWRKSDHKNCFELIFLSAEARYWLGGKHTSAAENRPNRLKGHSVGVYGAWGYYDIEHNFHGHQGHGYSAGLDYLFALPIAKGRLHLEFQAALGGIFSQAQPYDVKEVGGHLIRERGKKKNFTYFGPTKLAVSLVIPFCRSEKPVNHFTEP